MMTSSAGQLSHGQVFGGGGGHVGIGGQVGTGGHVGQG